MIGVSWTTLYDWRSSSAVLALTALWEETRNYGVLRRAVDCGNRLASAQMRTGLSAGGWLHGCRHALTGFSHGAAGNAYALLRLHAITGESSFRTAAVAALNYERRHNNWPDNRDGAPTWAFGWCNGAPGVGLGRAGARRLLNDPVFFMEIDAALARRGPQSSTTGSRSPVAAELGISNCC